LLGISFNDTGPGQRRSFPDGGAGAPLKFERFDGDDVCMGVPFPLGPAREEEGVVEVADDGVGGGASLGSGLAEGDGEGVFMRVENDLVRDEGVSTQVGDLEGGSGECGEERGEASMGVPGHPRSASLFLSTGMSGLSATKLLVIATVVNVDAEGGGSVISGGATLSMVVIIVDSLGEAEFFRGRRGVVVFPFLFRFRMTPRDAPNTGVGVLKEVEATADDMTM